MVKIFTCFLLLISINFCITAQVGINTENPSSLSVLDIRSFTNTINGVKDTVPQGVFIPRLNKAKIDAINVKDLDEANSLLVYNLDEDCYNFFSKTEKSWISICGGDGSSGSKSTFTINCDKVTVSGTYRVNEALTSSNYLTVQVTVTKAGSYTISATSTNGYYFSKSGDFLAAGTYPVRLDGTGTPLASGANTIPIVHTSSAASTCSATINVVDAASQYTLTCDSTKVLGVYEVGQTLSSSHKIEMYVNVSTVGGWSIESNTVDGISFTGSGTFTKTGYQWISVAGKGMPTTDTSKKMTLLVKSTSNDGSASAYCTAYVKMTLSSKFLGSIAVTPYMITGAASTGFTSISALFRSPYNFGTQDNSTVKMHSPTYSQISLNPDSDKGGMTGARIASTLYQNKRTLTLDGLFISYNGGLTDQAAADTITTYLQKGGVVVLLSSQIEESQRPSYISSNKVINTTGTGNLALMRNLFGPQVTTVLSTFNPGDTWRLPMVSNDDTSLNGPFGDVRNCYLTVSDAAYSSTVSSPFVQGVVAVSYDGIPINKLDWVMTATNYNSGTSTLSSNIVGFKASGYNFIWLADPSLFYYYSVSGSKSGTIANLADVTYAPINISAKVDKNTSPYPTVNSKFLANLLAWAMERAEYNGINSK